MRKEASFQSIIRVRNTQTAIEAIIACVALGIKRVQEGLDKRVFKLDEKFGWTLDDLRAAYRLPEYAELIKTGVTHRRGLLAVQEKINTSEAAKAAPAPKPVAKKTKRAEPAPKPVAKKTKRAGRKAASRARSVAMALYGSSTVKASEANQAPKPKKTELQEHIAQLLANAQAVARKRNPDRVAEAQAQIDRDMAAVLSMIG